MATLITDIPTECRQLSKELKTCADGFSGLQEQVAMIASKIRRDWPDSDLAEALTFELQNEMQRNRMQSLCCFYADRLEKTAESYEQKCDVSIMTSVADWWNIAYPIIEQIANVTGAITGVVAVTSAPFLFAKWIREKIRNKSSDGHEHEWVQRILREDAWNASSLSDLLSITESEAKNMLKGFGYAWDSKKMQYLATENTEKLRNIQTSRSARRLQS